MPDGPVFHHGDDGTAESHWLSRREWDAVPALDAAAVVGKYTRALIVSAHPDDETIGVGGLLSTLGDAGTEVLVLVATDGERSHPVDGAKGRAALGSLRRREVRSAVSGLAPSARLRCLGLPDGQVALHQEELAEEIRRCSDPGTLVLAPWVDDGHPDHDSTGRACAEAVADSRAALAYYPVWLWHWAMPDVLPWSQVVAFELPLTSTWRKRAALEEFRSQTGAWIDPTSPGDVTPAVLGLPFLDRSRRLVETLIDPAGVLPTVAAGAVEDGVVSRRAQFDQMYDRSDDPWGFAGSFYEDRRRALVLAMLGRRRYERILEIGCADGHLTASLAERSGGVVALDTSPHAVAAAQRRAPGAVVSEGTVPRDLPCGPFDLIVLSEVGYFLTPMELISTLRRAEAALAPGGELLLCHWQHPTKDVPLDGILVHDQAATVVQATHRATYSDDDLRIDVWGDGPSVAERDHRT